MKIHICFKFKDGPWGGANQFLKALKQQFINMNCYVENPKDADVILFNSNPSSSLLELIEFIFRLKKEDKNKIIINRIDGPVYAIRGRNKFVDFIFYYFNKKFCDGTIFQSNWSKLKNYEQGMFSNKYECTILNAPDNRIFNLDNTSSTHNKKTRIIANSWSSNMKKGFLVYKWLDDNLDFSKYDMTFVGNSPYDFSNIKVKKPMSSDELSKELKLHDIYITASEKDPCSNSLIEALHCGLPAIGLNDGGHPEIISERGETFSIENDIPDILDKVLLNYSKYKKMRSLPNLQETSDLYYHFMNSILKDQSSSKYIVKQPILFDYYYIKILDFLVKVEDYIYILINRIVK